MKFLFSSWKIFFNTRREISYLNATNILHLTCNVYGTLFVGLKNSISELNDDYDDTINSILFILKPYAQYIQYRSKVSWQSLETRSSIIENFKDRDASRVSICSRYEFRDVQDASFVTSLEHLETRKRRNFRVINFSHVYICVSFTPSEK